MIAAASSRAWTDANQRTLIAELARLHVKLGGEELTPDQATTWAAARAALPAPSAIDRLVQDFNLSPFEREVLLLCAGVEMDSKLADRCAAAIGQPNGPRKGPTFGLALAVFDAPHWSALTPVGPLRRWRLIELDESTDLTSARLRINERILHYLAGVNYLDVFLRDRMRPASPPGLLAESHEHVCTAIRAAVTRERAHAPEVMVLAGDDPLAHADIAAQISASLGLLLHTIDAENIPADPAELRALCMLWEREAVLLGSALLITSTADSLSRAAKEFIESGAGLVFVSLRQTQGFERPTLRFSVNKPAAKERKILWKRALGEEGARLNGAIELVAAQFRLSARTIDHLSHSLAGNGEAGRMIWSECRQVSRAKLDDLAQRLESRATWDDLILPELHKATLREISVQLRNRLTVYFDWGFAEKAPQGLGISALFAGDSGTGKTMAAQVIANELELDLYRIDLSSVVSKYIGETEKNLRRVFDAAEESGAILLFDEADSLFGKRSEVKDSHDRYANIEVSYLLQRMETYQGLAILTSNLKASIDVAFMRRLRFSVQFPFPDQKMREAIWRRSFPGNAPLGELDFSKLARLNIAGGNIRNIALGAAFRAAELKKAISMEHLLEAAHREAGKRERPLADAETRGWV